MNFAIVNFNRRYRPVSSIRHILVLAACSFFLSCGWASGADVSREFQLKAAFLYNFTKFVQWPETQFQGPTSPLVLGVIGQSPVTTELETLVKNRKVGNRALVVQKVSTHEEADNVHLLFVPAGEELRAEKWLQSLSRSPLLTVGESPKFEKAGGIINFVLEDDKLCFNINEVTAEKAGLKLSAQLLKLAKSVEKR